MTAPLDARFWAKVLRGDGCWLWRAGTNKRGYGRIGIVGKQVDLAHRVAWELVYGPIPDGLCVLHHCDIPSCVRPSHLFLGTRRDNFADMRAKGREHKVGPRGERAALAKLTETNVLTIRARRAAGEKLKDIAPDFGISLALVSDIARRKIWKHLD